MLDDAPARVVVLVGPAGYGKTTLARQWLSHTAVIPIWFRATAACRDVAALASGLAGAAALVNPEAALAVRRHLTTTVDPAVHAEAIARTLSGALSTGRSVCLVIDDYDSINTSDAAEHFVDILAETTTIRILVIGRQRPAWASSRRLLYGTVVEIPASALALTQDEARAIMSSRTADADVLWQRTKGWPALLSLAALASDISIPGDALPHTLYGYFADELYRVASKDTRRAMVRVAAIPTLRLCYVRFALGDANERVLAEALALGFLARSDDDTLEMHPLLRTFLQTKAEQGHAAFVADLAAMLIADAHWDDAFTVIQESSQLHLLPALFEAALPALIAQNRLATLDSWISFAHERQYEFPLLLLAEAETARRRAQFELGEVRALQAATMMHRSSSALIANAYAVAGECAHHAYRPRSALEHHILSETFAATAAAKERALWGQFTALIQLEQQDPSAHLEKIENIVTAYPDALVRLACGRLTVATLDGSLSEAVLAEQKYLHVRTNDVDPLVTTSFLYRYAYTCVMVGRYEQALEIAQRAYAAALEASLPFANAHITAVETAAMLGMRHLKRASDLIDSLQDLADDLADAFENVNASALRARLLLAESRPADAATLLASWQRAPTRLLQGETCALRALALAILDERRESRTLAERAANATRDVQAQTLSKLALAVRELRGSGSASNALSASEVVLARRANFDSFVCAYRAYPPLLGNIWARNVIDHKKLSDIIIAANDVRLAKELGLKISLPVPRQHVLSRRERDVYGLMCKGFTNREIAQSLFISEVTAKVHVKHIMVKLDARSRTEAVLKAYHAL
jgi:ATP/maltotriose-dependent transcriptional regulator MalT